MPPNELLFGVIDGTWPIEVFADDAQAVTWLQTAPIAQRRRVWRATIAYGPELKLIAPVPYLAPVENAGE